MLPPMIYKVLNPNLSGLADEGAYLMICKAVLPTGLLGLMLGGMIFATSSSVNTTLNISAGVFTNDIFKRIYKEASEKLTMNVARSATFLFGILTIIIALLVPKMGGIVEVVLSVGAITGGAMFLPPIWAMFSKRQTGATILTTTILSLSINLFFKFVSPILCGFGLSRSYEMMVGVVTPFLILLLFESYFLISNKEPVAYLRYLEIREKRMEREALETEIAEDTNTKGRKIIAVGIMAIGILLIGLGIIADYANMLVMGMGLLISLIALAMHPWKIKALSK